MGEVLATIKALTKDATTTPIVTDEMHVASDVSHRTVFMDRGLIAEHGASAEMFRKPGTARLAEFLGKASL